MTINLPLVWQDPSSSHCPGSRFGQRCATPSLIQRANQYFQQTIPLIAYEGGPSIYTDNMDGGDVRDDSITSFMVQMNNPYTLSWRSLARHCNRGLTPPSPMTAYGSGTQRHREEPAISMPGSAIVTVTEAGASSRCALQETTINLPLSKQMTPVTLDLIEVFAIEVRWYLEPDAQGEQRMGAIDNLRLNHRL